MSWPHAPPHYLGPAGVYMVTSATYLKEHRFHSDDRIALLQNLLFITVKEGGWDLEAWSIFANHYHFIARSPSSGAQKLGTLLGKLHTLSARVLNRLDNNPGRNIWHNYRESEITNDKAYLARLHYVHANAVHHGLVHNAADYPWCSAAWFERTDTPARIKTIYSFPVSRLIEGDEPL